MSDIRIIKKYPNRRLYDTAISRYITLEDVKLLVLENVEFKVVDAKTNEDLTNITLLQIIVDQEDTDTPMFTREILQNVIRFYGDSMQSMMSNYLEQSMNFFLEQQGKMKQGTNTFFDTNPITLFTEFAEKNMDFWKKMQASFLSNSDNNSSNSTTNPNSEKKT